MLFADVGDSIQRGFDEQDVRVGKEQARRDAEALRARAGEAAEGDTVAAPYQAAGTPAEEDVSFEPSGDLTREVNRPTRR